MQAAGFVKVKGKAVLADMEKLDVLLKEFNQIGRAIAYVTKDTIEHQWLIPEISGNVGKARIKNLNEYAKQRGLQSDSKFMEHLAYLLKYGYGGLFQARITIGDSAGDAVIFSANLKKEHLREAEHDLVSKYGRRTDRELTILGVAVQVSSNPSTVSGVEDASEEPVHMKEALFRMINAASALEDNFLGRLPNEIIIDPIAVYHEI